jgi:hypothetical protein
MTQGKGDRKRETKAKRERIMQKLRPMSEKPKKNSRIIITDGDGLESLVTFMAQKVRCSALTYKPYMLMWDDMVTHGNYKGWHYLNEIVKVEWVKNKNLWTAKIGNIRFRCWKIGSTGYIGWKVIGFGYLSLADGTADSLEAAQAAAIKWYNENIANRAEVVSGYARFGR